jgi:hypothetical protein
MKQMRKLHDMKGKLKETGSRGTGAETKFVRSCYVWERCSLLNLNSTVKKDVLKKL